MVSHLSAAATPVLLAALIAIPAVAATRDLYSDTWVRRRPGPDTPGYAECGAPKSGKTAALFYFLWLGQHGPAPYDITKLLARIRRIRPGSRGRFHHWGESELGYYVSSDTYVVRKHAHMLADAGVDLIVFDVTNGLTYSSST